MLCDCYTHTRLELYDTALNEAIKRRVREASAVAIEEGEAQLDAPTVEVAGEAVEAKKGKSRKATTTTYAGNQGKKKFSTESKSTDLVYATYGNALRVLSEDKTGNDFRNLVQKSVPKHMRQDVMTLVEESRKPTIQVTVFHMLQLVAVANQTMGRREFSSKDMVLSLAQHTDELIQWLSLEGDRERGVTMIKTLEEATKSAPAQYQFTHLSFQVRGSP